METPFGGVQPVSPDRPADTDDGTLFAAFLARQGMPTAVGIRTVVVGVFCRADGGSDDSTQLESDPQSDLGSAR